MSEQTKPDVSMEMRIATGEFNKDYPLHLRVDGRGVRISHDAQRDAEAIGLTWDEWQWVKSYVGSMQGAIERAKAAISDD